MWGSGVSKRHLPHHASRLILLSFLIHHHHLRHHPRLPNSPATTCNHSDKSPSPLSRNVGLTINCPGWRQPAALTHIPLEKAHHHPPPTLSLPRRPDDRRLNSSERTTTAAAIRTQEESREESRRGGGRSRRRRVHQEEESRRWRWRERNSLEEKESGGDGGRIPHGLDPRRWSSPRQSTSGMHRRGLLRQSSRHLEQPSGLCIPSYSRITLGITSHFRGVIPLTGLGFTLFGFAIPLSRVESHY